MCRATRHGLTQLISKYYCHNCACHASGECHSASGYSPRIPVRGYHRQCHGLNQINLLSKSYGLEAKGLSGKQNVHKYQTLLSIWFSFHSSLENMQSTPCYPIVQLVKRHSLLRGQVDRVIPATSSLIVVIAERATPKLIVVASSDAQQSSSCERRVECGRTDRSWQGVKHGLGSVDSSIQAKAAINPLVHLVECGRRIRGCDSSPSPRCRCHYPSCRYRKTTGSEGLLAPVR